MGTGKEAETRMEKKENRGREHKKEINVGPTTYRKTGYIWAYKREKE